MTAKKKSPTDKTNSGTTQTLRDDADKELLHSPSGSSDMNVQTLEALNHELQVHQIELEIQTEELRRAHIALEESRDKYIDLYEFAPVGYLTLNNKTLVTEANLSVVTLLGAERNTLINHGFGVFITPEHLETWDQYFKLILNQRKKQTCTLMLKRGNGSVFSARLEGIASTRSEGAITVHIAISDITDIWQIEALRESEERYRTLTEESPDQIFIIGRDDIIQYVNTAALKLLHLSYDQVVGKPRKDLFSPEIFKLQDATLHRVFETGEGIRKEAMIQLPIKELWIDINLVPLKNLDGIVTSVLGISRDITERKKAEAQLQESERRMKAIISFLPDATLVVDKNGTLLAWNHAMEEMTGVPAQQMIGKANYEYALPFYHERRPITVDLVLHDDPAVVAKYPFLKKEGNSLISEIFIPHLNEGRGAHLWFIASPLYDEIGNITGAIESIRDITERKRAEEALAESEEIFREVFNNANDAIFLHEMLSCGLPGQYFKVNDIACKRLGYT
ncbi:MAG: PAS domain-containing protein, partial [Methanobacteriota archaeon]